MAASGLANGGLTADAAAAIARLVDLLRDRIGLNPDSVGRNTIERAIERHRSTDPALAPGMDWTTYLARVMGDSRVFASLVEQVVVPETWFFRDHHPFAWLQTYALEHWLPEAAQGGSRRSLRVLSAPCASGEEPYSIVMTLLLAGFPAALLTVDAIDICDRALDRARQGLYSKHSFRGMGAQPSSPIDRASMEPPEQLPYPAATGRGGSLWELVQADRQYFHPTDRGWQLDQRVAKLVNFQQANLLTWPGSGQLYDVIFCRNLLIYLEPEARQQALDLLSRLLRPGGVLLVGAAEAAHVPLDRFESLRQPFTFAYRHRLAADPRPPQPASPRSAATPERSPRRLAPPTPPPTSPAAIAPGRPALARRSPAQDWVAIQALADQGAITEAIDRCQSYLVSHQTDAAARLLLGQLYGAAGDSSKSEQQFRQALYLNPQCSIALTHLALLLEAKGNRSQAALFRQRLARLPATSGRSAVGHDP